MNNLYIVDELTFTGSVSRGQPLLVPRISGLSKNEKTKELPLPEEARTQHLKRETSFVTSVVNRYTIWV